MAKTRIVSSRHISTKKRKCLYCSVEVNLKGIASHERRCKKVNDDTYALRGDLGAEDGETIYYIISSMRDSDLTYCYIIDSRCAERWKFVS